MLLSHPKIEILATQDFPFIRGDNLLFLLQDGKACLKNIWNILPINTPPYEMDDFSLTLHGVPLIQMQSSGCSTCESLLAAGYGIPEDCAEIRQAAENLRQPFTSLENALERLMPVVGLLATGAYLLASSDYFPTDGAGHFFWDVPNDFTAVKATATFYDVENFCCLPSFPCFLYPSQPTAKFDAARVEYYRAMLRAGENIPPALTYHISGSVSVLLDGHHRACACALEGVKLPCLTLAPASLWMSSVNGNSTQIPPLTKKQRTLLENAACVERVPLPSPRKAGSIFSRNWPSDYHKAMRFFPTCREAAALACYPSAQISTDGIHDFVNCTENNNIAPATALLDYLSRQKNTDKKALVLPFTLCGYPDVLRQKAFKILCSVKDDPEIEDLFIDYLVNQEDRTNPIWEIVNSYWEPETTDAPQ